MWSSVSEEITNSTNSSTKKVSSSSSTKSSSSSSQSYSSFSTISSLIPNPRKKTMEEVWKDINLTSLNEHPTRDEVLGGLLPPKTNNKHNSFRGTNLQEFLARPFSKDHPPRHTGGSCSTTTATTSTRDFRLFGPPAPPPATVLCLNSGPEFHYLDNNTDPLNPNSRLSSPFDAFGSTAGLSNFCKKRVSEPEDTCGERRHKRMIKNRESAARSRARKQELQAYTNELQLEVDQLREENARLQKQQTQIYLAASAQLPKKHTLLRTSTAPF